MPAQAGILVLFFDFNGFFGFLFSLFLFFLFARFHLLFDLFLVLAVCNGKKKYHEHYKAGSGFFDVRFKQFFLFLCKAELFVVFAKLKQRVFAVGNTLLKLFEPSNILLRTLLFFAESLVIFKCCLCAGILQGCGNRLPKRPHFFSGLRMLPFL